MRVYRRTKELQWLDDQLQSASIVVLTGARGVGKSTIVRDWLSHGRQNSRKNKWYTMLRLYSLKSILSEDAKNLDVALEHMKNTIAAYDVVVWDKCHLLSSASRVTLMNYLKNSTSQKHIIISDESLLSEFEYQFSELKVQPLTSVEVQSYVVQYLGKSENNDFDKILEQTNGFPLFINLYFQSTQSQILKASKLNLQVSDVEKEVLEILTLSRHSLSKVEIASVISLRTPIEIESAIEALTRKHLITEVVNDKGELEIGLSTLLKQVVLEELSSERKSHLEKMLLQWQASKNPSSQRELFIQSLMSDDPQAMLHFSLAIEPSYFESLSEHDTRWIYKKVSELKISLDFNSPGTVRVMRFQIRLEFLSGQRQKAIEICKKNIKLILKNGEKINDPSAIDEMLHLGYECVHWLNRNDQYDLTEKVASWLVNRCVSSLKSLLQIELVYPHYLTDFKRAEEGLKRILKEKSLTEEIRTQLHFELAQLYHANGKNREAYEQYKISVDSFLENGQSYFGCLCLMNMTWLSLEMRELAALSQHLDQLRQLVSKYGYRYLRAGTDLCDAILLNMQGQSSASLIKMDMAIETLNKVAPRAAQVDAYVEKAKVLVDIGLLGNAEKILLEQQLRGVLSADDYNKLRLELGLEDIVYEEAEEFWSRTDVDSESAWIEALRSGIEPSDSSYKIRLQKYFLGQLALVEYSLRQVDQDGVWSQLIRLEQLLTQSPEPRAERVFLALLQSQLAQENRESYFEKVEFELSRWGADRLAKYPLMAWLELLRAPQKSLDTNENWKRSRRKDQIRWHYWVSRRHMGSTDENNSNASFEKITANGREFVGSLPKNLESTGVVVVDSLGQVLFKNKELKEFHRKSVLRQILVCLLEAYPNILSKGELVLSCWGESYNPTVHDPRIYTSVQRLRSLLTDKSIESIDGGYRWNSKIAFTLYKAQNQKLIGASKIQTLILQSMKNFKSRGQLWVKKSDFFQEVNASDATIKRALANLLSEGLIERQGSGAQTRYCLKVSY